MAHPCSDGGPGITRLGCTKFNEECTKGPKMRSEVRIDPQSLTYESLNEIMDNPCLNGGSEFVGSDVPNLMKDIPRVPKYDRKWGSAPNHFVMGF